MNLYNDPIYGVCIGVYIRFFKKGHIQLFFSPCFYYMMDIEWIWNGLYLSMRF